MSKIEAGCLCVIVSSIVSENNGKACTLVRFVGAHAGWQGEDWWEIDIDILDNHGVYEPFIRSCRLMRIDDVEFKEDVSDTVKEKRLGMKNLLTYWTK